MKYTLTQKCLGSGTYGKVYKCITGKDTYAFKQFTKYDSTVTKELAIAVLLKSIDSKNCAYAHDIKLSTDKIGYVMDIALDNLWNWSIDNKKILRKEYLPSFLKDAMRGLSELHSLNIVHGDIKLANLLVYKDMSVKICDYGFSSHKPLQEHQFMYTPNYRSPEAWKDQVTKAADVWALGVSMIEVMKADQCFINTDIIVKKSKCKNLLNGELDKLKKFTDDTTYSLISQMLKYDVRQRLVMDDLGYRIIHKHNTVCEYEKILHELFDDEEYLANCSYDPIFKIASDWYEIGDPDWNVSEVLYVLKKLKCKIYY